MIKVDLIQGHGLLLPLDKENSFVLESAGPVCVDDEVTGSILRDHHRLWLLFVKKSLRKSEKICTAFIQIFNLFVSPKLVPLAQ